MTTPNPNQSSLGTIDDFWPDYFRDTGCNLAASCLNCPFKVCQHDIQERGDSIKLKLERRQKDLELMSWWKQNPGLTRLEVAMAWGISERTVYRVQKRVNSTSSVVDALLGSWTSENL